MPRRFFLHVGSPKTGTTFLQNVLWSQRDIAREHGLLLPMSSRGDHYRACLDVRGDTGYSNTPELIPGTWRSLVEEAGAWDGDVLVSHELFAPTPSDRARKAVADLSAVADEVHVVVTARDLVRQFPAHWQENVKARSSESFGEFMAAVQADTARDGWFWLVQDSAGILDRWGADLAPEQLHVVTVPEPGRPPSLLWERFSSLLGLDPARFSLDQARANESLGPDQVELLRRVNAALGDRLPRPGPYAEIVKGYLAHRVLVEQPTRKLGLDGDDLRYAVEHSTRIAGELRGRGVHVVGDLEELEPPAEPTGSPAREVPTEAEVLGSAVEVIVTVLERVLEQRERREAAVGRLRQKLRACREELDAVRSQPSPRRWSLGRFRR